MIICIACICTLEFKWLKLYSSYLQAAVISYHLSFWAAGQNDGLCFNI